LAALASRQAFTLHHESFPFDVERLIPAIERSMRRPRSPTGPGRRHRRGHSPLPGSTVAPVAGNHREPSGEAASQNVVGPRSRLLIGLTALVVTIGVGAIAVAIFASGPLLSRSSQPSLASASPTTESPASSASPAPPLKITPSGSPRRQASPSPTPSGSSRNFLVPGDSVTFEHHVVTVLAIERPRPDEVWLKAKVCVRKLPPHPQHGRTRISWAPWEIHSGVHTFDPGSAPSSAHSSNTYPSERTYGVGDCAAGWIPFPRVSSGERIGSISYTNQLGDTATWHTSI
jgi:hypothetical protein